MKKIIDKTTARLRRAKKTRIKIKQLGVVRLTVHRTPKHIYAQLIDTVGKVIVVASTVDPALRKEVAYGGNVAAAKIIGRSIAERALSQGIKDVAFDRSGFKYHGRIKALADAARASGLNF